ncbi:hypothetical protein RF11_11302 [Thelohanellus kitauei]|uniref:Uncharacterized protein n=1 Tax=Thelohanellus kitauei TaxID=669202 RepID=A0A0C2IWG5_THEKT|nr:hypothetical protein RF11_11302 [Thelohanellus kitauei]
MNLTLTIRSDAWNKLIDVHQVEYDLQITNCTRIVRPLVVETNIHPDIRCVFVTFIDRKLVIKYQMRIPQHVDVYPSVLVQLEVFDLSVKSSPMIMNLSLGGWRIECPISNSKTNYNPKIIYDNNGNDVSIHITIYDSVNNYQEMAMIGIINNKTYYHHKGSIDRTNIEFIPYHQDLSADIHDTSIRSYHVIPLVPFSVSRVDCYIVSTASYLINYTYDNSKIKSFMMSPKKVGKEYDVFSYTKMDDNYIEQCEQYLMKK